jgi:outer membrane murein-binding lipoprotein Lpp
VAPGEILMAIVLGLLTIAFGLWAKKVDDLNRNVEKIYTQIHNMAIQMERRITRTEERIHHHAQILNTKHFLEEEG